MNKSIHLDTLKLFGTDGIRGRANTHPMTVEMALSLGRALGTILRRNEGRQKVVIGKDTRLSCYMFESALISGLCSMGVDTLMVGPLPTPGVSFITRAYRANAGIVISASHNSYHDNGIKLFSPEGFKFPGALEEEIEAIIAKNSFDQFLPDDKEIGRNTKINDADGRYIEFIKATFPKNLSLRGLKIALDCSNGSGYRVAPFVFEELDAKVFTYGNEPNGLNINLDCGSLHPKLVQKAVIDHKADVGIALDGDADRVLLVDEKAQIIDGDTILGICAKDMKDKGLLENNIVIGTVMSNFGFMKAMENLGIRVIQSRVGDRFVIEEMLQNRANLGGEQSGHLIFLDHNTTGDGLVSALQVLRIMIESKSKLSDLSAVVHKYPQVLINVMVASKPPLDSIDIVQKAIRNVEEKLADKGRVLVRYSGTENICRVMVEGPNQQMVTELAQEIAHVIEEEIA